MHAYLMTGDEVGFLADKLSAKQLEFTIQKIEDVRELNKFLRLTINEKTLIVIRNIQNASEESLNAFLKNLEEPQENIYFVLTTPSISQVLPTIVSRCQIIKTKNETVTTKNAFIDMNKTDRLAMVEKIKDRTQAIKFVEDLMNYLHQQSDFTNLELILKTHTRLNASGNVNLQLSNLALNYK